MPAVFWSVVSWFPSYFLGSIQEMERESGSLERLTADRESAAMALDYRADSLSPRALASDVWTEPSQYAWREVAPTFPDFVNALGLEIRPAL
jgi:hypothetical protein